MNTKLTETAINAAARRAAELGRRINLSDPDQRWLHLRITPHNVRTWCWAGTDPAGRVRRFTLGHHPQIGLAEARRRARTMAEDVRRGADPVREARAARAPVKAPVGHTLADLLRLYGEQSNPPRSWARQMLPQITRVFRAHLNTPLADLRVGALQMTLDGYQAKQSAAFGVRCMLPVLRWAAAPGRAYADRDLLGLSVSAPKSVRNRVLSRDELAALLPALRASTNAHGRAMHLILLTLVRREEAAQARWRDIDFTRGIWTLPATKNGQPHLIPLSRQAVALLRVQRPEQPDPNALVFISSTGKGLNNWEVATEALQSASGTDGWHRHDLRRTGATMLGELGVLPDIIEAALNHTVIHSPLAAVYNRSRYRPEVAAALQKLADAFDGIETGGAEVVRLHAQ